MKKKARDKLILRVLLALSVAFIIIIIFIGSFSSLFSSRKFYDIAYNSSGTYNNFNKELVDNKTSELFLFFEGKFSLDSNFYTENEISHMNDVRLLVKNFYIAYYLSIVLLLMVYLFVFFKYRQNFIIFLLNSMLFSGILSIFLIILFLTLSFSGVFESFHKIFFSGNYTFPYDSHLIMMFPEAFFMIFAKAIFILSALKAIIISLIGFFLLKKISKLAYSSYKRQKT